MKSLKRKIFFSNLVLILLFTVFFCPFIDTTVKKIVYHSLEDRTWVLIHALQKAADFSRMIDAMHEDERFLLIRVALYDGEGELLYDPLQSRLRKKGLSAPSYESQPEILQAIEEGVGFSDRFSDLFQETFSFVAVPFESHGAKYILQTGFRYNPIHKMIVDLEKGFLFFSALILLLFMIIILGVFHRLTKPIQQVINAILPYQEGSYLPHIDLKMNVKIDEFKKLASTMNSLTERIRSQIENLMQQRKETEGILDSLGEGIIALDTSASVTYANQVACQMLGVAHNVLVSTPFDQIKMTDPDLSKKCHELILQVLQTSESAVQTCSFREIHLELFAAPLANQHGAILVLQDKTSEFKVLEMGKEFIANASHELRTPITIIRGFAETLQDLPNLSQELLHEITHKIVKTCGRLDKLVKSLLTLTDIENFSVQNMRTTDLVSIVENCKQLIHSAHPEIKTNFQADLYRAPIMADGDLIDLAVMNLLDNAVKYSPSPAEIDIRLRREGTEVLLDVSDRGIGIPEGDLNRIFDRFYTVDKARSRKSGGAGLGLSIVKTIVDKHKGMVKVASKMGIGSTFTLAFPIKVGS